MSTTLVDGEMDPNQESDNYLYTTPFVSPVRPYDAPKGKLWFMPPGEAPVKAEEPEVSHLNIHSFISFCLQT